MNEQLPKKRIRLRRLERRLLERVILGEKPTHAMRKLCPHLKRPNVRACVILAQPHVKEARAQMESDALAAAGITRAQIVRELGRIAFSDPRRLLNELGGMKPLAEIDDDTAAVIAGMDVEELYSGRGEEREQVGHVKKVKFWNKREALAELAHIAGLKREHLVAPETLGPGLTVIVQNGGQLNVQQNANAGPVVPVNLPKPE
jgi:phage terminase small subunit